MSMIQIAFLKKADIPTKEQIQNTIQMLGYDFTILKDLEKQIDQDGLECSINGHQTYFETYINIADDTIAENGAGWIKSEITNQDISISFIWGADFAAGACVGLVSVALIDLSNALIYYMDDHMKYTRKMLLADTPQFLAELNKSNNLREPVKLNYKNTKSTLWNRIKSIFK